MVRDGAREKKVFFVDGVPEVTLSNDESERLSAFLVARGLALPMEIEMGLAMAPRYGGRLGDALVGLGVLRPVELMRAVLDQTRHRFVELVGWKRGELSFIEGERCRDDDTMPDALNAVELIARGIVMGYSSADLAEVLAPLQSSLIIPVPRSAISVASLKLPPMRSRGARVGGGPSHVGAHHDRQHRAWYGGRRRGASGHLHRALERGVRLARVAARSPS